MSILEHYGELFAVDEGLQDFVFGLKIGGMTEQNFFVFLEPLLGLDATVAQLDQVDNHDEHEGDDSDGNRGASTSRLLLRAQRGSTKHNRG